MLQELWKTNLHWFNTNQPTLFQRSAVLKTGLSDFHLLTATEFKMSLQKCKPHIITLRNYKIYDNDVFRSEIETFCSLNETDLGLFKESIFCIFNKHAPIRKKYIRANGAPFMNKELHNTIMKRSRYRNEFFKIKVKTSREFKKFSKTYVRNYWGKPKFVLWKPQYKKSKASRGKKIILTEAEKHTSDDKKICKIFNNFFSNVSDLKIPDYCNYFVQKNTCSLSTITDWKTRQYSQY